MNLAKTKYLLKVGKGDVDRSKMGKLKEVRPSSI